MNIEHHNRRPGTPRIRPKSLTPTAQTTKPAMLQSLLIKLTHHFARQHKRAAAAHDLNATQGGLLQELRLTGPATVAALARRGELSRQACQHATNLLIARNLVTRRENPAHRRSGLIELTAEGLEVAEQAADSLPTLPNAEAGLNLSDVTATIRILEQLLAPRARLTRPPSLTRLR